MSGEYCRLLEDYGKDGIDWLLVVPEITEVNLKPLADLISRYDAKKPHFIGRVLVDEERSITHHYADPGFKYPDSAAGILLSWSLVSASNENVPADFSIDPRYEVSQTTPYLYILSYIYLLVYYIILYLIYTLYFITRLYYIILYYTLLYSILSLEFYYPRLNCFS